MSSYYYNYNYEYRYGSMDFSLFSGAFLIIWIISLCIGVFGLICLWKVFVKAGKPGWAAIIPIYNIIVLLEITEMPMWYIVLFFIPIGNIIAMFFVYIELAHRFGKSTGFGVGLVLLSVIFLALLAFDKNAKFQSKNDDDMKNDFSNPSSSNQSLINTNENNYPSFCTNCGSKLDYNQKFCSSCGSKIL